VKNLIASVGTYFIFSLQPSLVATRLILTAEVMAADTSAEGTLKKWLSIRSEVERYSRELWDAQKRLRVLESRFPWLGNIKGMLRKKDGKRFDIPEGPRLRRVLQEEQKVVAPPQEERTPRHPQAASKRKCPPTPLMEKSRREAEAKRRKLKTSSSPGGSRAVTRVTHLCDLVEMPLEMLQEAVAARERGTSQSGEGTQSLGDGEESIGGEN
jgi:hypothetical protein